MIKNKNSPFTGAACAIVTPFNNGEVDFDSLGNLIDRQLSCGIDAIAVCGTTGEAPALSVEEYQNIVEFTCTRVDGEIPVIAGSGGSNTKYAVKLADIAAKAGADALLAVTPYYNKASSEGLFMHYKEIAGVGLPVILYNVPSRTGVNIPMSVYRRLSDVDNIVAVKEASGDIKTGITLAYELGDRFALYSGCDELNLPLLSVGFDGFISVTANITPAELSELWKLWKAGDTSAALDLDQRLYPLTKSLFTEVNPIPVKAALSKMGLCKNELRLPLTAKEI